MIHSALAFFFSIHTITPVKAVWVALTLANVAMMYWLFWKCVKSPNTFIAALYFVVMAEVALLQGNPTWGIGGEVGLAAISTAWVLSMLPRDKYGRVFALSVGLCVTCVLIAAVPPPWPHYPPELYFTRLYSTAAFLGISLASAFYTRSASTMLCVPWFMAVLFAGSQRGFDRWTVGVLANATWTACLICWMFISRRKDEVIHSAQLRSTTRVV